MPFTKQLQSYTTGPTSVQLRTTPNKFEEHLGLSFEDCISGILKLTFNNLPKHTLCGTTYAIFGTYFATNRIIPLSFSLQMNLEIVFWFDQDNPIMKEIARLDSLCARLWYEHTKLANNIRQVQKDKGTECLSKPIDKIWMYYASDKVLKRLSESDQVLINRLFKHSNDPDHESDLRHNLFVAHQEYIKYNNLRKQQIKLAEEAELIHSAHMRHSSFEQRVEPCVRLLGFDSYQGTTCGELQDCTHKPYNVALLKSCIMNHFIAPPDKGTPYRVKFI